MKSPLQTLFKHSSNNVDEEEDEMDDEMEQETRTDRGKLEEIRSHVDTCPLGWFKGALMKNLGTSDEDVIKWLQHLFYIAGSKKA